MSKKEKNKTKQYIQFPPIKDLYRINEEVFLSVPCTMGENNITDPIQNLEKVHWWGWGGGGEEGVQKYFGKFRKSSGFKVS